MGDVLADLPSWTTYGTWLPGDDRGWLRKNEWVIHEGNPALRSDAARRLAEPPLILDAEQRRVVQRTIEKHCRIRNWHIHALNVRTNHLHLVVTADEPPEIVMAQLKAWCTRRLKELEHARQASSATHRKPIRRQWWTEHGSTKWINDETYLENAILYVLSGQ